MYLPADSCFGNEIILAGFFVPSRFCYYWDPVKKRLSAIQIVSVTNFGECDTGKFGFLVVKSVEIKNSCKNRSAIW